MASAAMLNLSTQAAQQVVQRAMAPPLSSNDGASRFSGFSQHYEDYSPAVDHLSMMRIATHEMLLGRLNDAKQVMILTLTVILADTLCPAVVSVVCSASAPDNCEQTITLFPGFPAEQWDVSFKLHGPLNTTVEATCVGGKLTKLIVTPPERKADVRVFHCQQE